MPRNPYHASAEPKLQRSVFVFMDILGYSDLMIQSEKNGTQHETLHSLHRALSKGRKWLDDAIPKELQCLVKTDRYALKAFTDNIVIGWPVRDDAESELGDAFFKIGAFQFQMALEGYFVRGAISVGDAYVDEIAVFGGALMEAYHGESMQARDPRIILVKSAVEVTKRHLKYYGNPKSAPHVREVLCDVDGQWFLNYLECILWAEDEQGPFFDDLLRHKAEVEKKLLEHKANPPIWSKYAWVATYHNYFCNLHSQHFGEEHKVKADLFKESPCLIVD